MSRDTAGLFSEFAGKEFPRGITCYHSIKNLHEPLLTSPDQVDQHVSRWQLYHNALSLFKLYIIYIERYLGCHCTLENYFTVYGRLVRATTHLPGHGMELSLTL
jgi:hypothetical protein